MTPAELVTLLKYRIANSNDPDIDTVIIAVANLVQTRLEESSELPWFLFKDTNIVPENLTTTISSELVALPSDFIREEEEMEYVLFRYDDTQDDPWRGMAREEYQKIKSLLTGEGAPTHYDIMGTRLYLRKIPDASYTLRLLYYAKDAAIVGGGDTNLWLTHAADWLLSETGLIMTSDYVVMPALAEHYREEAQRAQLRVRNATIARREAGFMRAMGGEDE